MSMVLRPELDRSSQPLITLMAGIAVHDAIRDLGMSPDIKWVNDILIGDRKICGILAEAIDTPLGQAVILGIGVNLSSSNFPVEIASTATSVEAETGQRLSAEVVAEPITRNIQHCYEMLKGDNGAAKIVKEWSERSSYCVGKRVRVTIGGNTVEGITDGLEENGALRVINADGSIEIIQAGDVERVRANN
jgi:BirA family biotin operon repressor/biotin-[acetyl-CoA-carboxylase] ligase